MFVADSSQLLKQGDSIAQDLVNSLQVLEVTAGAMSQELIPVVCTHTYNFQERLASKYMKNINYSQSPVVSISAVDGAAASPVHLSAASIHSRTSHDRSLCGHAQQDRYYGDHECVSGTCASLVGCY